MKIRYESTPKIWPCFALYLDAQNSVDFEREVQFVTRQILQCDNQDFMKCTFLSQYGQNSH